MGIVQFPAGVGNPIYIYDDAVNTNHPAAPGPHTAAEINAAFPVDFAIMQDAAGNTFSGNRIQYLVNVPVITGGQTTDGANYTSWVENNFDLFVKNTGGVPNLRWRNDPGISATSIVTTWGTRIGTGDKMGGKNGVSIHLLTGTFTFRGDLGLYSSLVEGQGGIQFQTNGGEVAGCTIDSTNSVTLGVVTGALSIYNSTVSYRGTGNMLGGVSITDSAQVVLLATAPNTFINSNSPSRSFTRLILSGEVASADFNLGLAAGLWDSTRVTWSDTVGKPRITMSGIHAVGDGLTDYDFFDTKVCDTNGNSIQACPVFMSSDVDGPILDTQTGLDGNVVFTWNPTGQQNVLPVRDYYSTQTGTSPASILDRVFTLTYNGYGGAFPPLMNYVTRQFRFTWPGRDRLGTGYQIDGGSFQPAIDLVMLYNGSPTANPDWTECNLI